MKTKNEYRKFAKGIRPKLNIDEISNNIHQCLINLPEYKRAKNIFIYNSFRDEICTQKYFEDKTKNWFVPKVGANDMLVCKYDPENLVESCFGIMEPISEEIEDVKQIDLVILPALCVDKKGYRIGYGKGFYDRFLNKLEHNPCRIVLVPEELIVDSLPIESFDEKCNIILTEKNIFHT